jgi:F420-non-reducing hydrogenase large subunit
MRGAALAQDAIELVGGRVGLPICAMPGGVARPLGEAGAERLRTVAGALLAFVRRAQADLHAALDTRSAWQAFFDGEAFALPLASLALFGERGIDWLGGQLRAVAADGVEIARFSPAQHAEHIAEWAPPGGSPRFAHLQAHPWSGLEAGAPGLFRVGPLARLNASGQPLSGAGQSERLQLVETHSVAASLWASLIELLDASEMLAALSQEPALASPEVRVLPAQVVGEGAAAVEGPAGLVLHAYRADARGIVRQARVLDPTALNHAARGLAARQAARRLLKPGPDEGALRLVEFAVAAC